ncbi:MAG: hypothetical protein ACR2KX_03405 [Chitinophagaceae bacterium]
MHKILVVDDDQSILDSMEIALNLQDYEVETTTKGQETFSKIESLILILFLWMFISPGWMAEKFVNK